MSWCVPYHNLNQPGRLKGKDHIVTSLNWSWSGFYSKWYWFDTRNTCVTLVKQAICSLGHTQLNSTQPSFLLWFSLDGVSRAHAHTSHQRDPYEQVVVSGKCVKQHPLHLSPNSSHLLQWWDIDIYGGMHRAVVYKWSDLCCFTC